MTTSHQNEAPSCDKDRERAPNSGGGDNLRKKTARGLSWRIAGVVSESVLMGAVSILLTRLLEPEDFGLISMAALTIMFSKIVSDSGLSQSMIQRKTLTEVHVRVGFTTSVLLGISVAGTISLIAPLLASFFHEPRVTDVLRLISITFVFVGLGIASEAIIKRDLSFSKLTVVEIVSNTLGYGLVSVTMALMGFGVWSLVFGKLAQAFVKSTVAYMLVRHSVVPSLARKELKDLARFGIGATLHRMFNFFARQGDYLVIGHLLDSSLLGLYQRAYRTMEGPLGQTSRLLTSVLFPAVARIQDDLERVRSVYAKAMAITSFLILPIMVVMVLLADELIVGVFGPKWEGAVAPFRILSMFGFFRATYQVAGAFIKAIGHIYRMVAIQFIYAGLVVGGTWYAATRSDLEGVAVAVGLAIFALYLMQTILAGSLVKLKMSAFLKLHIGPVLVGALTIGIVYGVRQILVSWDLPRLVVLGGTIGATIVLLAVSLHVLPRFITRPITGMICEVLDQGVLSKSIARKVRRLLPRDKETSGDMR